MRIKVSTTFFNADEAASLAKQEYYLRLSGDEPEKFVFVKMLESKKVYGAVEAHWTYAFDVSSFSNESGD